LSPPSFVAVMGSRRDVARRCYADVLATDGRGDFRFSHRAPTLADTLTVVEDGQNPVETMRLFPWDDLDGEQLRFSLAHNSSSALVVAGTRNDAGSFILRNRACARALLPRPH